MTIDFHAIRAAHPLREVVCIYAIRHEASGKTYVGQTHNLRRRMRDHLKRLRAGNHSNRHLQRAFLRYGEPAFSLTILEECQVDALTGREQAWIDTVPVSLRYNLAPVAGSTLGVKYSDASRKAMSEARKGRVIRYEPAESRRRSEALIERNKDPAFRALVSSKLKGRKQSEGQIAKLSATRKGRKLSEAHKRAIGEAAKRKRSPETRANMAKAARAAWSKRKAGIIND